MVVSGRVKMKPTPSNAAPIALTNRSEAHSQINAGDDREEQASGDHQQIGTSASITSHTATVPASIATNTGRLRSRCELPNRNASPTARGDIGFSSRNH